MKKSTALARRHFLASATAAVGFFGTGGMFGVSAAEKKQRETLAPLLGELEGKGRQMLSVPRKDGQFLNILVRASRARNILEIGTSQGYSAIWMALALEETGGKLTTIDIAPEKVKLAKENLKKAGLDSRVNCLEGDAHQLVTTLDGPFDLVFLDADKEGQTDYFNKLYPKKVVPGGIIAVHNAIRSAAAMKDYLEMIDKHPDFDAVVLSMTMEDGFSIACRHRS